MSKDIGLEGAQKARMGPKDPAIWIEWMISDRHWREIGESEPITRAELSHSLSAYQQDCSPVFPRLFLAQPGASPERGEIAMHFSKITYDELSLGDKGELGRSQGIPFPLRWMIVRPAQ